MNPAIATPRRTTPWPALVLFFASIFLLYPGFLSWDSVNQLMQARSGSYGDWHPPFMSATWHYIDHILSGPFGMLSLQLALFVSGLMLVLNREKDRAAPIQLLLTMGACLFFPPVLGILGSVWKDVLMEAALLLCFGIAGIIGKQDRPVRRWLLMAVLLLLCVYVAGLRYNAILAILPLIWLVFQGQLSTRHGVLKSLVIGGIAASILTAIIVIVAFMASKSLVTQEDHPWVSVAAFDLAGITIGCDTPVLNTAPVAQSLGNLLQGPAPTLDRIRATYTPRYWYPTTIGASFQNLYRYKPRPDELLALRTHWMHAVAACPLAYLAHRWRVFKEVIGFSDQKLWSPVFMKPIEVSSATDIRVIERQLRHDYQLSALQQWLKRHLDRLADETILFRPYIYILLLVPVAGLGLWRLLATRDGNVLFLALSGMSYQCGLFFVAPSADFRYSHWSVVTFCVSALVLSTDGMRAIAARWKNAYGVHRKTDTPAPGA